MTTVRGPVVSTLNSGLCRLNRTLSAAAAVGSGTAKSSGFTTWRRELCIPAGRLSAIGAGGANAAAGACEASGSGLAGVRLGAEAESPSERGWAEASSTTFARRDDGPLGGTSAADSSQESAFGWGFASAFGSTVASLTGCRSALRRCASGRVLRGVASSAGSTTGSAATATEGETDPLRGDVVAWPELTVGSAGDFVALLEAFGVVLDALAGAGGASSGVPRCRRTISLADIGCGDLAVLEFGVLELAVAFDFDVVALPLVVVAFVLAPYSGASSE